MRLKPNTQKKIWIDLDNSPHVPFFRPIILELEKRGYSVILTARDCFQVCDLANLFGLSYKRIGRHYGKNKLAKAAGLLFRTLQMSPTVLNEKPDISLSHGSRSLILLSSMLRIPIITIADYEHSWSVAFRASGWSIVPDVIPDDANRLKKDRILKYPGIKEDVYVPFFRPDPGLREVLGIRAGDLVVTVRPPATEAHYHNPEAEQLQDEAVQFLTENPKTKIILVPRNARQGKSLRKRWSNLFATGQIMIPDRVVDGLNLLWHSDLVISGGGTMNREAAALGVPVYSVFRGKIGAVDRYLADSGRLVLLESVEDVRKRIKLEHRQPLDKPADAGSATLQTIVNHVVSVIDSLDSLKSQAKTFDMSLDHSEPHRRLDVGQLNALAARGLVPMFDSESRLFCYRMKRNENGLIRDGSSVRYTIISLLGLHKLESTGAESPIDVRSTLNSLLETKYRVSDPGDLGLLLWLCALAAPERMDECIASVHSHPVLIGDSDAYEGRTMELAWLLTGLSHAALAHRKYRIKLTDSAVRIFNLLKTNYGGKGIFGHQRRSRFLAGILRARIGTFADQVYPIYALSKCALAFQIDGAAELSQSCAQAIIRAQGPLGQWCWHYDSSTGEVTRRYPVFSVHQDGMAPMALFAAGEASGIDFSEPIYEGLHWIGGNNELNVNLVSESSKVIWRSIHRNKHRMYLDEAQNLMGLGTETSESRKDLSVNFECRPYHFGWLLYAFAARAQQSHSFQEPESVLAMEAASR